MQQFPLPTNTCLSMFWQTFSFGNTEQSLWVFNARDEIPAFDWWVRLWNKHRERWQVYISVMKGSDSNTGCPTPHITPCRNTDTNVSFHDGDCSDCNFWIVTPCSLADGYQRFGGACLRLLGWLWTWKRWVSTYKTRRFLNPEGHSLLSKLLIPHPSRNSSSFLYFIPIEVLWS
jgi:hypothetical protein